MHALPQLVYRTALPFQYLLYIGLPLLGAVLFVREVRAHARPAAMRLSRGLAIGAAVALCIGLNEAYGPVLDLAPVVGVRDLVGLWREGSTTLELRADGTYRCSPSGKVCEAFGPIGHWTPDGGVEVSFTQESGSERITVLRRVVRYAGALHLTAPFDDPDGWDGAMSFAHSAPAS